MSVMEADLSDEEFLLPNDQMDFTLKLSCATDDVVVKKPAHDRDHVNGMDAPAYECTQSWFSLITFTAACYPTQRRGFTLV